MHYPTESPDVIHGVVRLEKADTAFIIDFESDLRRLEQVRQLGLVGEVYKSAGYSKLEHTFGAYHLLNTAGNLIPRLRSREARGLIPVMRKAFLAHSFGRLPLTFAMEQGLADATNDSRRVRRTVVKWINLVRDFMGCQECSSMDQEHLAHEGSRLHSWISAWKNPLQDRLHFRLADALVHERGDLQHLIRMLVCPHYEFRRVLLDVDAVDYVLRDFHHSALGTLQINFEAVMRGLGEDRGTPESRFIRLTEGFLRERLYGDERVALLERLVGRLGGTMLAAGLIGLPRLIEMDDPAVKRALNRRRGQELPVTLDMIVEQVVGGRWFCVGDRHPLPLSSRYEMDGAFGNRLTYPFHSGLVVVPIIGQEAPGVGPMEGRASMTALYAQKDNPSALGALAALLLKISAASEGALANEQVRAASRALSLALCSIILCPGKEMRVHSARLEPNLNKTVRASLGSLGISPGEVIEQIVEIHCNRHGVVTPEGLDITIGGQLILPIQDMLIRDMSFARLPGAPEGDQTSVLVRATLERQECLPKPLIEAMASELARVRDDISVDSSERAVAAELREYLLEPQATAGGVWVFPPCQIVNNDGTVHGEVDGLILRLAEDELPHLSVLEITTSETAEKAATDLAKVAKLTASARSGANVELRRRAPRDSAPFETLR